MAGLYVFVGGGCGALCRWGISLVVAAPWGTFAANVLGSFLLAMVMHPGPKLTDEWKLALATGFLGAFTTYSTFNLDVMRAAQKGDWTQAATICGITVLVCLASGLAGWQAASWWWPSPLVS